MRKISLAMAINETLEQEMGRDKTIFLIGEDIGIIGGRAGVTSGLLKKFGSDRVIDTPVNEELFVGIGIGAAETGLRPVIEFAHGSLITLAAADIFRAGIWRQICFNKFSLPIIIRVAIGDSFGPELSAPLFSMFLNLPGLIVVAPSTPYQAKGILNMALRGDNPVIILEYINIYKKIGEVPISSYVLPIKQAEFRKIGDDISIISYSYLSDLAEEAAIKLFDYGVSAEILDLVSLKPLDTEKIIKTAEKNKKVLVLGIEPIGSSVLFFKIYNLIKQKIPETEIIFCGYEKLPIPYGPLRRHVLLEVDTIVKSALSLTGNKIES